jgi:hypothetical protein
VRAGWLPTPRRHGVRPAQSDKESTGPYGVWDGLILPKSTESSAFRKVACRTDGSGEDRMYHTAHSRLPVTLEQKVQLYYVYSADQKKLDRREGPRWKRSISDP